ncbi:hypothetical protein KCTCHS21_44800 [Cohnella abietis]|uniref:Uncharacterized protein n=1 Tax=Cohnella abietis TaxID=2507935 RepID=A0A3T1DAF3_9BACL|nr:hypothetical protein KCTCHS21_44800 [Cohnella abietis]
MSSSLSLDGTLISEKVSEILHHITQKNSPNSESFSIFMNLYDSYLAHEQYQQRDEHDPLAVAPYVALRLPCE